MIRYLLLLGMMTSCSMYRSEFDCPPGIGVPCTSVTTLEKMVVESPCGEDDFLGCVPKLVDAKNEPSCLCTPINEPQAPFQRRIWIAPRESEQPLYIYFEEEVPCEEY